MNRVGISVKRKTACIKLTGSSTRPNYCNNFHWRRAFHHRSCGDRPVKDRIAKYHERFPQGEPMYKRKGPWRMFIETRDIMLIKRISLRSAQRLLQNTRFLLEKKPDADITVTAFCSVNDWDEKEVRAFLDKLDEEDDQER